VICVFRPLPGKEDDLRAVLRDHLPTLRREGLVTDRTPYVMKAKDGAYVEVFEWKSDEAIRQAHGNPRVGQLWKRFEAACTYGTLESVAEIAEMFPNFDAVEL
jgi:quinol monooxygenase YgiN